MQADHYIPMEELRAAKDERWHAMVEGRWDEFGGEAPDAFRARVGADGRRARRTRIPGDTVVAVCHGGVINAALGVGARARPALVVRPGLHVARRA